MSSMSHSKLPFQNQLIALWIVFQLGLIFHTQLGLMPLFHGLDVLAAHGHVATDISQISSVLWLMLAFFLMPLIACCSIFANSGSGVSTRTSYCSFDEC
mgnify:CR=1 FL=1